MIFDRVYLATYVLMIRYYNFYWIFLKRGNIWSVNFYWTIDFTDGVCEPILHDLALGIILSSTWLQIKILRRHSLFNEQVLLKLLNRKLIFILIVWVQTHRLRVTPRPNRSSRLIGINTELLRSHRRGLI